jgi:HKD family nuclease
LRIFEVIVLLTRDTLLERLRHHLQRSRQVDIAVAWACDCDALSGLLQFANSGTPLRAIIGISGNATHPNALRALNGCGQLRIATNAEGLFHPKFYLFHQHNGRIAWIGSANLTRRGFQQNEELVFEFADEDGGASEWLNRFWDSPPEDCDNTLDTYEKTGDLPHPPCHHPHQHRAAGSVSETYTHWAAD